MDDLIHEKEFIEAPYNPWKRFYIYFAIGFCTTQLLFWIIRLKNKIISNEDELFVIFLVILFVVLPTSLNLMMVFSKKDVLKISNKTIISGIGLMSSSCCLSITICFAILNYRRFLYDSYNVIIPFAIYATIFLINLAIIIPIINWKKKVKNGRIKQQLPQ
ncbi:hypothetical protein [Flavobacterium rhizosphaerae]|uniref:DUF4234 domain-containing protein n=1 Tax=Flavobacterium rhizosphaerae TaxID=3163298 RepID=A0ABW8YVE9_9FLAO